MSMDWPESAAEVLPNRWYHWRVFTTLVWGATREVTYHNKLWRWAKCGKVVIVDRGTHEPTFQIQGREILRHLGIPIKKPTPQEVNEITEAERAVIVEMRDGQHAEQ